MVTGDCQTVNFPTTPFRRTLLLFTAFVSSVGLANAVPILYGVTDSSQFGTVNLNTNSFSLISTLPFLAEGLVSAPNGFFTLSSTGEFVSIGYTGVASNIGDTGLGLLSNDIAEIGSTVYALDTNDNLYRVNTASGALTTVGSTGITPLTAANVASGDYDAAFQGANGNLYYSQDQGGGPATLYRINTSTGAATPVGSTLSGIDAAISLGGTDYVFQANGSSPTFNEEYTLNLGTGATSGGTTITGGTAFYGVAAPEPASFALAGIGGIAFCAFRSLRRRDAR
jgi:hypothetical protein